MKGFSNASFSPDTVSVMKDAMDPAVATLPDPVSLGYLNSIAEAKGKTYFLTVIDPHTIKIWDGVVRHRYAKCGPERPPI
jgi:hypothetical protein